MDPVSSSSGSGGTAVAPHAEATAPPPTLVPTHAALLRVVAQLQREPHSHERERRRLLRLAEWALRTADAYARLPSPPAMRGAATASGDGGGGGTTTPTSSDPAAPLRAGVPVERRLSYPGGHTNAHEVATAPVSAAAELFRPHLATAAAHQPHVVSATVSSLSASPPPPVVPRGRRPLCCVVGAAFDVPDTHATRCAVLAAQGGCCARCGVVLPRPAPPRLSVRCGAFASRVCAALPCGGGGGGGDESSDDGNQLESGSSGGGLCCCCCCCCWRLRPPWWCGRATAAAVLDSDRDGDSDAAGPPASQERDELLGSSGAQQRRQARVDAAADDAALFCAYEGHYLCRVCFHRPATSSSSAVMARGIGHRSTAATADDDDVDDHGTRYVAQEEWQVRASEGVGESPVRAAVVMASAHLREWWLARHVALPTAVRRSGSNHSSRGCSPPPRTRQRASDRDTAQGVDRGAPAVHMCVLPAHVLHRWSFSRHPVSAAAAAALQARPLAMSGSTARVRGSRLSPHPSELLTGREDGRHRARGGGAAVDAGDAPAFTPELYDVSLINPALYTRVPALAAARRMRQRLVLLHSQAWWCPHYRHAVWGQHSSTSGDAPPLDAISEGPATTATAATAAAAAAGGVSSSPPSSSSSSSSRARRRYLVERAEGWSLQDLHRLTALPSPPPLLGELQAIAAAMQAHVSECNGCTAQCRGESMMWCGAPLT
ncbi:hypothetical protein NESM_000449600 [Novymonas esmeraldas]|uniref:Rubicon Homology domain-containing protein n=1 Tax=Novymonas esmeraldas TaxID=1808958 RepID=A0AAW0EMI7_9TRYP